ncbi:MAG TPA: DsbA family protein [Solirubrobacteraceae bacterium]
MPPVDDPSDLRSAPLPPVGAEDHVRGDARWPLLVVYADFTCPRCALAHERLHGAALRIVFRHFAIAAKHPRAVPLACAAEAAAAQGRFWELHDALFEDPAHTDDPHLWEHAKALGIDLERFERDRRGEQVRDLVRAQTRGGMRAGVAVTPTLVLEDGTISPGPPEAGLIQRLTK